MNKRICTPMIEAVRRNVFVRSLARYGYAEYVTVTGFFSEILEKTGLASKVLVTI